VALISLVAEHFSGVHIEFEVMAEAEEQTFPLSFRVFSVFHGLEIYADTP
jgi:hypothetical protein